MNDEQENGSIPQASIVAVRLTGFEDASPQYANIVHVTSDRDVFQLIFSAVMPPVIQSPDDFRALQEAKSIPGQIVARLILSPRVYEEMIDVLQTQLRTFKEALERGEPSQLEVAGDES